MENNNNKRLLSLDVFRGFDMMFIMGVEGIAVTLCSLFPGTDSITRESAACMGA